MPDYKKLCMNMYLIYRWVFERYIWWDDNFEPVWPTMEDGFIEVNTDEEIEQMLIKDILDKTKGKKCALMLSAGMDSALLAGMVPKGTKCYTIDFASQDSILTSESKEAYKYASYHGLDHETIYVTWEDYLKYMDLLMLAKRSPLHPVEVGLYIAAQKAAEDGCEVAIVGNGADSTFGGMNKLMGKEWTIPNFIKRYTFVEPKSVLKKEYLIEDPDYVDGLYHPFNEWASLDGEKMDVQTFMKVTHGTGVQQFFNNAILSAGLEIVAPFETISYGKPLDIKRLNKEPKYALRPIWDRMYPTFDYPPKLAFARPTDVWLKHWSGPKRQEFKKLKMSNFTGDQKFMLFCLERWLNIIERFE